MPAAHEHEAPIYRLGLPAWAFAGWRGVYFDNLPSTLASYASVFSCVEGNLSFYGIPGADTVAGWQRAVAGGDFRFSFKLPRSVTHEPRPSMTDLDLLLQRIAPLGNALGPLLIQFPASAGPAELARFEPVFEHIAVTREAVVEVRHPTFFAEPDRLAPMLQRYGYGRVMLDSSPLYEGDRTHPDVQQAVHEKPDVPVLDTVYGNVAFVRLILHPDIASNARWIERWSERMAQWLRNGIACTMMIHCPNNQYCPALAVLFHEALRARLTSTTALPALRPWPVPQQRQLF